MDYSVLKNGDIIFTSKKSIIAKLMAFLQKDEVKWGHVGVIDADRNEIVHAIGASGVSAMSIDKFIKKYKVFKIIRMTNMTEDIGSRIISTARKVLGIKYSWFRIFMQTLDHVFHTDLFTALYQSNRYQVCSSFVAWAYYSIIKIRFNNVDWYSCDPDDIEDHSILYKYDWEIVYES